MIEPSPFQQEPLPKPGEASTYAPIGDYAVIGDCRCAALVSKLGSIDWLCLPRFDSAPVFAALLDARQGGRFVVRPAGEFRVERRYVGDSNVLETTFGTKSGALRLTDLMPIYSREEMRRELCPERSILRVVECLQGKVEVEVIYEPRFDYERTLPHLIDRRALGLYCEHKGHALTLCSEVPLELSSDRSRACAVFVLRHGERCSLSVTHSQGEPAVISPLGGEAQRRIANTVRWWRNWVSQCKYQGPYRDAVVRSALTLKLMTYAPSGAVIAAPTTSLPEKIGGGRNWDYRYCWLRDASMTLRAFFKLGYTDEGEAFLAWLLHSTQLTRPELQVMYDVYGETDLRERELEHLDGYAGSRPVRVGNDAGEQFQLDIYGEVVEAAFEYTRHGGSFDRTTRKMLRGLGKTVCRKWREPDEGIWEIRSGRRHHTYSKVMCWVALDRLVQLHEAGHLRAPVGRFVRERDLIRREIETYGYSDKLQSYVSSFGSEEPDASLLLMPIYGYTEATAPRMRSTYVQLRKHLKKGALLYRYGAKYDGLPAGEGASAIAGFWGVEHLVRRGDIEGARTDFERMLSFANDIGLFGEEIDADTGAVLGNFPQAFTHIGLINAALALGSGMRAE